MTDREQLLDELGRCFVRAALNQLLADPEAFNKNAAESRQEPRRRKGTTNREEHTRIQAADAT